MEIVFICIIVILEIFVAFLIVCIVRENRKKLRRLFDELTDTVRPLKTRRTQNASSVELLSEPVDEATKAVVRDMYPRPITLEEAEKEVLDIFKNGPVPGTTTKRLKCGTIVIQAPFELEIPEGYEMARLNPETGYFEYSDGTIEHHPSQMRKIQREP